MSLEKLPSDINYNMTPSTVFNVVLTTQKNDNVLDMMIIISFEHVTQLTH